MVVVSYPPNNDMAKAIKVTIYSTIAIVVMLLVIFFSSTGLSRSDGAVTVFKIGAAIEDNRWWFRLLRYAVYITLLWLWPVIIHKLAQRYHWQDDETRIMLHYRNRMLIWIVLVELILIENLIGQLLRHL